MHKSVTMKRVTAAVLRSRRSLDNPGFCTACGAEAGGYECETCGEPAVYGAEELLIHGVKS